MALTHWVGGIVGTGAIIVAGGNLYADQKLKDFYLAKKPESSITIKSNEFNMGLFSGEAKNTIDIVLDPCQPNEKFSFQVVDTISRGIFGYNIKSQIIYSDKIKTDLKRLFGEKEPITIQSSISWTGNTNVKITSPEINHKEDDFTLNSKGGSLVFDMNANDQKLVKNLSLTLPSLTLSDSTTYFMLDQFRVNANKLHATQFLGDSKSDLSINLFRFKTYAQQPFDISLEQIKGVSQTDIKGDVFNINNKFNIGKFSLLESENIGKLDIDVHLKDLNLKTLQAFSQVLDETSTVCKADNDERITQALLAVLEQGLKLDANSNASINKESLTTKFSASLNKTSYPSLETLTQNLLTQTNAEGQVETSRSFISALLSFNPEMSAIPAEQVDQFIAQLQSQGMLKVTGDKITSKFEVKQGNPRFTN